MKLILLLFTFLVSSAVAHAQQYDEMRVEQKNGKTYKLKNAHINLKSRTLMYTDFSGNQVSKSLDAYSKIEYRKGNYWLEGLIGGFAGSVIANIAMRKPGQQWWYGIGQSVIIGTVPATVICGLIPKYKKINLGKKTRLEVSPLALRLRF